MQAQPDHSPAADRNKQAILDVLVRVLPEQGRALEIASGTGQHVAWFAATLSGWNWQPSDAQHLHQHIKNGLLVAVCGGAVVGLGLHQPMLPTLSLKRRSRLT